MHRLKELRKDKKMTQEQLAESIQVTKLTISNWENNKHPIKSDKVTVLADLLGVSVPYLLGLDNSGRTVESVKMTNFQLLVKESNKSLTKISQETGISYSTLGNYNQGTRTPKRENAKILSDYFGVSIPYLLGIDANSPPVLPASPKDYLSKQEELSQLVDTIVKTKALDSYLQFLCHKDYSSESINTLTQLIYDYLDTERKDNDR